MQVTSLTSILQFIPAGHDAAIVCHQHQQQQQPHLRLQVEPVPVSTQATQPFNTVQTVQANAKVAVQAIGNKLAIEIEFPQGTVLNVPRTEMTSPALISQSATSAVTPAPLLPVVAKASDESTQRTASSSSSSGGGDDDVDSEEEGDESNRSQKNGESTNDLSSSYAPAAGAVPQSRKSDTPLFERAIPQSEATEPVHEPAARAAGAAPATQFNAVAASLAADHEAMAMHRVSEDDARIKARRQEERIDQAAARHARPSTTGVRQNA